MAESDSDNDGSPDCVDLCPLNGALTTPSVCGCADAEADSDGDGLIDCLDGCPHHAAFTEPGRCGCGVDEAVDEDANGVPDCMEACGPGACHNDATCVRLGMAPNQRVCVCADGFAGTACNMTTACSQCSAGSAGPCRHPETGECVPYFLGTTICPTATRPCLPATSDDFLPDLAEPGAEQVQSHCTTCSSGSGPCWEPMTDGCSQFVAGARVCDHTRVACAPVAIEELAAAALLDQDPVFGNTSFGLYAFTLGSVWGPLSADKRLGASSLAAIRGAVADAVRLPWAAVRIVYQHRVAALLGSVRVGVRIASPTARDTAQSLAQAFASGQLQLLLKTRGLLVPQNALVDLRGATVGMDASAQDPTSSLDQGAGNNNNEHIDSPDQRDQATSLLPSWVIPVAIAVAIVAAAAFALLLVAMWVYGDGRRDPDGAAAMHRSHVQFHPVGPSAVEPSASPTAWMSDGEDGGGNSSRRYSHQGLMAQESQRAVPIVDGDDDDLERNSGQFEGGEITTAVEVESYRDGDTVVDNDGAIVKPEPRFAPGLLAEATKS